MHIDAYQKAGLQFMSLPINIYISFTLLELK